MRQQGCLGGSSPGHASAIGTKDSHWQGHFLTPGSLFSSGEGAWPKLLSKNAECGTGNGKRETADDKWQMADDTCRMADDRSEVTSGGCGKANASAASRRKRSAGRRKRRPTKPNWNQRKARYRLWLGHLRPSLRVGNEADPRRVVRFPTTLATIRSTRSRRHARAKRGLGAAEEERVASSEWRLMREEWPVASGQ